jgi:uncharacterized protein (TIGR03435 family)
MRSSFPAAVLSVAFGLSIVCSIEAQPPTFDVASVRIDNGPFVPGESLRMSGGPGSGDPGRFTCRQYPLRFLITRAYDVLPDQVVGPAWLQEPTGNSVTVSATMPVNTTKEDFLLMLQGLLAERFHLTVHHETRNFPGYELVVAAGGSKLTPWVPDPTADASPPPGLDEQGFPRLRPGQPGVAFRITTGKTGMMRSTHRQTMVAFARGLGNDLNSSMGMPAGSPLPRVADKTGLSGLYEFRLEFEGTMPSIAIAAQPSTPDVLDPGDGGPSLFTALEKQLGLKLVKTKSLPVDLLIIDQLDKTPTDN